MNVGMHPAVQARRRPEHLAYVMASTGEEVTYRDLDDRSMRCAHLYRSFGLATGDVVAILADNHRHYLSAYWGAQRSGLYFTPVSLHLTAPEVLYILEDSGAGVLLVSSARHEMVPDLRSALPRLRIVSLDGPTAGCDALDPLLASQPARPLEDQSAGTDMLYTSGTTGVPKGVRRPLDDEVFGEVPRRFRNYGGMGWDEGTVCMSPGPLYHSSPLHTSVITQFFGGTNIVPGRFDAERTLAAVEAHGVTHLNMVPTHFVRLLRLPEQRRRAYDLSSLRLVLHGAAPCAPEVKRRMIEWLGPIITEYYGGTEGLGGALISSEEWLAHPGSVGRSVLSPVHVLDEVTGEELPPGAEGALYFEDPPPVGYHNAPDKTASMRSRQGWATYGDIGSVDSDGYIYITDRRANLIITGGVNIYPREAEDRLLSHASVADAAVFGVPDEDFGEQVRAVVQLVDGAEAHPGLAEELIAFCREVLSPLKCPKDVRFADRLPRDENGKLYKRELRDSAAAEAQR